MLDEPSAGLCNEVNCVIQLDDDGIDAICEFHTGTIDGYRTLFGQSAGCIGGESSHCSVSFFSILFQVIINKVNNVNSSSVMKKYFHID